MPNTDVLNVPPFLAKSSKEESESISLSGPPASPWSDAHIHAAWRINPKFPDSLTFSPVHQEDDLYCEISQ